MLKKISPRVSAEIAKEHNCVKGVGGVIVLFLSTLSDNAVYLY